ncbi:hypothetical protein MLD38_022345 [Melastoma candidum]|uniref:Uncharacterized protein n=1 Tax=Melastoma candidum TaxID=119954 RepID=A0ACB9QJH0_9MYRT|nr:hypothetical protein MLD38_022345 [Melastoma candidum]
MGCRVQFATFCILSLVFLAMSQQPIEQIGTCDYIGPCPPSQDCLPMCKQHGTKFVTALCVPSEGHSICCCVKPPGPPPT